MQQSIKKVRQIQGAGTYESPHGLLYKFDYTFEYNTNSTSQTSGSYQDRQEIILNEWAIGRAMEWEMYQSPPDRVSLRNAIALAKQLKTFAKDLENAELPNHNNDEQPF